MKTAGIPAEYHPLVLERSHELHERPSSHHFLAIYEHIVSEEHKSA